MVLFRRVLLTLVVVISSLAWNDVAQIVHQAHQALLLENLNEEEDEVEHSCSFIIEEGEALASAILESDSIVRALPVALLPLIQGSFRGSDKAPLIHDDDEESSLQPPRAFGGLSLSWPLFGKVSSIYGMRKLNARSRLRMHSGIDISHHVGAPILAAESGVIRSASIRRGYGKTVIIEHNNEGVVSSDGQLQGQTHTTLYAHLSKFKVVAGQYVTKGQVIGNVGVTGRVTGPNLHFETRIDGIPQNPTLFLPKSDKIEFKNRNLQRIF